MPSPPESLDKAFRSSADGGPTDEELASWVAMSDDNEAFAELTRRHGANLVAYCLNRLTDKSAAEDFAQEAWLLAWRNRMTFTDNKPGTYRKWLFTQAFRRSMDDNRKARRRPESTSEPMPVVWQTAELAVMLRERGSILMECIESLPERERCVSLVTLEGRKAGEAADRCGCTAPQASTALHAAKLKLAECTRRKGV